MRRTGAPEDLEGVGDGNHGVDSRCILEIAVTPKAIPFAAMPIYEYVCGKCGQKTEVIQRVGEAPLRVCPHCGGRLKKAISAPAIQFKGSGWYVTDYARAKTESGKGAKSERDDAKAERGDKEEKSDKSDKPEKSEKSGEPAKSAKSEKPSGKTDRKKS